MPRNRHADSVAGKSAWPSSDPSSQPLTASESFSSALSLGSFWFSKNAAMRGSISGFNAGPISCRAGRQPARSARCCTCGTKASQALVDGRSLRLEVLYSLLHLADGLQDFARHVFRGETLERLLHQGVLPAIPPQAQLVEHLLRVHQPQSLQRGLKSWATWVSVLKSSSTFCSTATAMP